MKELIVYYSLNGHVEQLVAGMAEPKLAITTVKPVTKNKVWQMISLGFRVIANKPMAIHVPEHPELEQYQVIHFVSPVWAGKVSLPVQSFIEQVSFKNKQVKLTVSCSGTDAEGVKADFLQLLDPSNELIDFVVISNQR